MLTRTIYIVRHGDALDCDEEKILLDEDRPLSELGHAQSAALGTYLAGRGAKIGEVATSPLLRARQTARGMLSGLGLDETKMVLCDELAPGVRVKRLADYLQRLDADDFVIVGHQPDLCEMLGWLIGSKKAPGRSLQGRRGLRPRRDALVHQGLRRTRLARDARVVHALRERGPRLMELIRRRGWPLPLGVSYGPSGLNFSLLCRHGTTVRLVVYDIADDAKPIAEVALDPRRNRTGDHWHAQIEGLPDQFCYGWRIDGPVGPVHRFDPNNVLLDPAATMLSSAAVWGQQCEVDHKSTGRRAVFSRQQRYDWGDDSPPLIAMEDSVVYELHVRGFTCHPSSGVSKPGTFAGLVEKIPHLKWLGVTAVELLPIHEFDECDCPFSDPETGEPNRNFWGYNTVAFAAPKAAYAASAGEFGQMHEFRDMVKAFHAAGIEVWLDVVFNHTGEGNEFGRTYSFRGLDNALYYMVDDHGHYMNFTGCGNTFNCNNPVVRKLILRCLQFWVADMHIDGLRFDLASIFGRDQNGDVMPSPPIIEELTEDGVLADTKLVAEPWDAAGLYLVGRFPFGHRWSEWNGRYRDDVRSFWKGDAGFASALATRLCGSSDLYEWSNRYPRHSLNFVTCHDGFTLNDLVSYNGKHNSANGEHNRDGTNDNQSWNCGHEGPTENEDVLALRSRQARNLFATLMLSQGVPMMLGGDEFLRTQGGNNNAWCQDSEISWVDWSLAEEHSGFLRFCREVTQLRHRHPVFRRPKFLRGELLQRPGERPLGGMTTSTRVFDVAWHGTEPHKPDFGPHSKTVAMTLDGRFHGREGVGPDDDFYLVCNAHFDAVIFKVPPAPNGRPWRRILDTSRESPADFVAEDEALGVAAHSAMRVEGHSMVVLIARQIDPIAQLGHIGPVRPPSPGRGADS